MSVEVSITSYGPKDGKNPCVVVRPGEDPSPTCVNPRCLRRDNCRKHVMNRIDTRTPSIAIIPWYGCDHYEAIDPNKYKANEQTD